MVAMRRIAAIGVLLACVVARGEDHSAPEPVNAGSAAPVATAASVEEALQFDEAERAALRAVTDGDERLAHSGLDVLLRRAAALPAEDRLFGHAQPTAVMNLLASPAVHRGRLIDMPVRVWRVSRWYDGGETATGGWGRRPVWRLDCHERASGEPLIVMLTDLPDHLPVGEFAESVRDVVLGLFYKVVRLPVERPDEAGADTRLYPVLVAKTLYGSRHPRSSLGRIALIVMLGVLVIGWILTKRSAWRSRTAHADKGVQVHEGDSPVDEALVDAVEEHRKRHAEGSSQ